MNERIATNWNGIQVEAEVNGTLITLVDPDVAIPNHEREALLARLREIATTHADETIIASDYILQVMRTGRGWLCYLESDPTVRAFASTRSYAVSQLKEKVEDMRCESCGVIEGSRHNKFCG
jgi:hypothetical protein